jgi:hypothetical protein
VVCMTHETQRLPVAVRLRHAKVAIDVFLQAGIRLFSLW